MVVASVVVVSSIYFSVRFHDWTWFGRAGGVVTLLGGMLATRRIIRSGVEELFQDSHTIDGGHAVPTPEEIEAERQDRLDIFAAKSSFWVISAGTIIWTFGDLLGCVIH